MSTLAYILISGVLGVTGQLILKRSMAALGPLTLGPDTALAITWRLMLDPMVILGVVVTVSGTFFWLIALSRVDLSYAYPFASLNYLLILLASWGAFGEQPTPMRVAGVVIICLGVWAISRTPARTAASRERLASAVDGETKG